MVNVLKIEGQFQLESGESLPEIEIAYHTYGTLSEQKDNVIWICHALTANSDAGDWWSGLVGPNKLYDPEKCFIVCANILGSAYGTTGPLSTKQDGQKYYRQFPNITIRDMVHSHILLRKHLEIENINTLIGGSIGSFQAIEWAVIESSIIDRLIIIAGCAKVTPWVVAFNESQRMSISADESYFNDTDHGGINGMKSARSIALLSYRNDFTYNKTQTIENDDDYQNLKASSYQQYQGKKFAERFNAYSYYSLSKSVDSHNLGRNRDGLESALAKITSKTLIIGIDTDVLFPYDQQKEMYRGIKNSSLEIIKSEYGHDGFLLENEKIENAINQFYKVKKYKMKELRIGLFGFGVVGEGLYQVLQNSKTIDAEIVDICVKQEKDRSLPESRFTYNKEQLLNNSNINIIVELIDDADEAYDIVKTALLNGKNVVSGNKKMLAEHLPELIEIQKETEQSLLYDASACGSIPIIRNIEEYYDNDLLKSVTGILNGSSNYILTQIFENGNSYPDALKEAQELGFAESNPTFDVDGFDSLYKLIIICTHSFGVTVAPSDIFNIGISKIKPFDIRFAKEKGLKIKLIAKVWKIDESNVSLIVIPKFVDKNDYIYNVEEEYNGVVIEGQYYDKQFMFGKGAGAFPTGSAVLSDITALSHNYKYEYKKQKFFKAPKVKNDTVIKVYLRYQNLVDFSLFEFETIDEKFAGETNYVIGDISIENLKKLQSVLPQLDIFLGII